eukprot:CAMPEP_0172200236 /NCGR_PEP_ID=MMETSP1050-20130122/29194_1 /TAXON_ID=233186 /ORGANISM="Cryptomonas curvata, Strain CCAP979/52" /LENGTH=82 /DNA_ID=CAMNT_0012877473 /DNA_START=254 /DNA_END=498 /DNA_ORIENTATION=-
MALLNGPYSVHSPKATSPKIMLRPVSADHAAGSTWPSTKLRPISAPPTLEYRIVRPAHLHKNPLSPPTDPIHRTASPTFLAP